MRNLGTFGKLGLALALAAAPGHGWGQQPRFTFSARLTPDTILIGDRVELTIHATAPQGYRIHFPQFADTVARGIEVMGAPTLDTLSSRRGPQELVYRLMVTALDSGTLRVPRLPLLIAGGSGTDTAHTSPMWLQVNLLPRDEAIGDMHDIKPPLGAPLTFREVAPWVGAWLATLALTALAVYAYRQRKRNKPLFFPAKPQEPPHVIALRALDALKAKRMWESEDHKLYYSACTDTLRRYIEGRFGVPAMERTTLEIIGALRNGVPLDAGLIGELEQTLTTADLVKFARLAPALREKQSCLEFAYRFVHSTTPAEAEPSADPPLEGTLISHSR